MNCIKLTGVPFLKHLFNEYYVYVDSDDYKADYLFVNNKVKGKIIGEWMHPNEKYRLINIKIKKSCVKAFEDTMEQLERKQLLSGNSDYIENANHLCNELLNAVKES